MKNNISRIALGVLSALLLIGAIVAGTSYAGSVVKKNRLIDEQTAEEFAILDAGVESDDVSDISTSLEYYRGEYEYHITFYIDNIEYEYKIRGLDGSIISKELENEAIDNSKNASQPADQNDQQGDQQARRQDDQQFFTDLEKTDQTHSGPDEIDQAAVVSEDPQPETEPAQKRSGNYISVEQAKKTALDHAGLTENEVKFSSAKLEKHDGQYQYDIEFYNDDMEYEYEIDAVTGEIIESEVDYD